MRLTVTGAEPGSVALALGWTGAGAAGVDGPGYFHPPPGDVDGLLAPAGGPGGT
jgi:hypothetical protein